MSRKAESTPAPETTTPARRKGGCKFTRRCQVYGECHFNVCRFYKERGEE